MLSALSKPDKNPFIAKKQATLAKQFTSWKKSKALQDANHLAWYLHGAGQPKAARSIVDEIADNVVFAQNYNVWGPAADAITAASKFAREAKDPKRSKQLMARIVEVPAYATTSDRTFIVGVVERSRKYLGLAAAEKRADKGCFQAANALTTLVYFAETLRQGGFHYEAWLSHQEIESMIAEAVEVIATRLPK